MREAVLRDADVVDAFRRLVSAVEPGLRRALVAAYGPSVGREATAEALAWAWEHFGRVQAMDNPGGYLYRVGQSAARRLRRGSRAAVIEPPPAGQEDRYAEPALEGALSSLSARQRAAVLLVHGYGYTLEDAATAMGCRVSTLRNHLDRGLRHLRERLGVTDDD